MPTTVPYHTSPDGVAQQAALRLANDTSRLSAQVSKTILDAHVDERMVALEAARTTTPTTASEPVQPAESPALPATLPRRASRVRRGWRPSWPTARWRWYLLRSSGRTRRVPYLPKGDERTAVAALRKEAEGKTLAVVAGEQGVSLSTLRHRLLALEVSEDLDAGRLDALCAARATALQSPCEPVSTSTPLRQLRPLVHSRCHSATVSFDVPFCRRSVVVSSL